MARGAKNENNINSVKHHGVAWQRVVKRAWRGRQQSIIIESSVSMARDGSYIAPHNQSSALKMAARVARHGAAR